MTTLDLIDLALAFSSHNAMKSHSVKTAAGQVLTVLEIAKNYGADE